MSKLSAFVALGALAGVGYYIGKRVFDKKKTEKEEQPELFAEERHSTPREKLQRASLFAVGAIKTGTEKIKEGLDEIVDNDMVSKGEAAVYDMKTFASDAKDKTVAFAKDTKDKTATLAKDAKDKTVTFAKDAKDKTVAFAKDKSAAIKDEIDNLKGMVSSINTGAGEASDEESSIIDAAADIGDLGDIADEIAEDVQEAVEEISGEAEEIVEDIVEADEESTIAVSAEGPGMPETSDEQYDEVSDAAEDINDLSFEDADSETVDTFDFNSADKL